MLYLRTKATTIHITLLCAINLCYLHLFHFPLVAGFSFEENPFPVSEEDGEVSICVVVLFGTLDSTVELMANLDSDTADFNDFNNASLRYVFPSGSTTGDRQCEEVEIMADDIAEDDEQFIATLIASPPRNDIVVARSSIIVIIEGTLQGKI